MPEVIADSDILIDYLRGHGDKQKLMELIASGKFATTAITYFELTSGAVSKSQINKTKELLDLLEIYALDKDSAAIAGKLYRELASSGQSLPMADCLIAGICLRNKTSLCTRNVKHFKRIKELNFFEI